MLLLSVYEGIRKKCLVSKKVKLTPSIASTTGLESMAFFEPNLLDPEKYDNWAMYLHLDVHHL